MNPESIDQIVQAVLYEGHILYPYRASSVKNQRERFTFGRVYPRSYSEAQNGAEPALAQTECLVQSQLKSAAIQVKVRFLQPMWREVGVLSQPSGLDTATEPSFQIVPTLDVDGTRYQSWQEAMERSVVAQPFPLCDGAGQIPFVFPASRTCEPIRDAQGRVVAVAVRRSEAIQGVAEYAVSSLGTGLFMLTARVLNLSFVPVAELDNPDAVLMRTFAATHTILQATEAEFVSLLDSPPELKKAVSACKNIGTWPVLLGRKEMGERDTLLSSPIILYDYPEIAPESRGDLFDGTEIDEILTLRILTMTDAEKNEMRNVDAHARRLLERTEALRQDDLLKMHGRMERPSAEERSFDDQVFGTSKPIKSVTRNGREIMPGGRVRIRPKARADVMDIALTGRVAIVEAVEEDAEQRVHLALVLEDDPGRDLGMKRQTGHRFFYGLDEVEPMPEDGSHEVRP